MADINPTPPSSWALLLDPHASVEGNRPRNRARRLAVLSLGLLVVSLLAIIITIGVIDFGLTLWAGIAVAAVSYALSRSPIPQMGGYVLVLGFVGVDLWLASTLTDPRFIVLVLALAPLPIVLSTLVLDAGGTAVTAFVAINGMVVLDQLVELISFNQVVVPLIAVVFISILAGVTAFLRERDLSIIESQNIVLDRFSRSIEEELATIRIMAEIGQTISSIRDVEQLLAQTVTLLAERFEDFHHAQIFLIDDAEEYAVLRKASGEEGKKLVQANHRFSIGSRSVIGTVTANKEARIATETSGDPLFRPGDVMPAMRAEMAFPLISGGELLGALDLQSQDADAFLDSDLPRYQTMVDQIASAIENAILFENAQNSLKEIESLNRRIAGEGWRRYQEAHRDAPIGYEAVSGRVQPLIAPPSAEEDGRTLHLPLVVRGEAVGTLDVKPRNGEAPDEELQNILQAVADRVALALDSSRLSDSALRQIEREQILSALSADLQATTDLDVILRIAAREASRALGTSRGFVHLSMDYAERSAESDE